MLCDVSIMGQVVISFFFPVVDFFSDGQQDGACIGTTFSKFETKGDEILMYYVGGGN
jgi:hypothetical protein